VQAQVDERMRAKRTRNYDLSDSIRDNLFREFDVTIHDKINEWSVGGDFGDANSWTHVDPDETSAKSQLTTEGVVGDFETSFESYYADQDHSQDHSPPQEESLSKERLACLTVVQLKEKLRDSGAKVSGTKAELINRLHSTRQSLT
jgi:hypothetical protein